MVEQAKEELQRLETHYPNRFESLKMELKSFILSLESQYNNNNIKNMPSYSSVTTQESTSRKRKKVGSVKNEMKIEVRKMGSEECKYKCEKVDGNFKKKRNRIDLVLENAQLCLQKIQEFKSSF